MQGGSPEHERALIDAAWSQFDDLTHRSKSTTRASGSFSARDPSGNDRSGHAVFPGYQVLHELKRGGQGVVLLAVQESTGRRVAIKALRHGHAAGEAEQARFEREIDLLSRLRHPNIVTIHDRGRTTDGAYFVMDLVPGDTLDDHIDPDSSTPREIASIFEKIGEAVSAAHRIGVIHRDLKPSNIRFDERQEPKVLDFGLARLIDDDRRSQPEITQTGQFIGSLPWASPEQVGGNGADTVDVRSDVYSIGVMLYHALTGQFPYPVNGTVPSALQHIVGTMPTKPRFVKRGLDDEIETIVLKCLAKEPERRYQSAGELARDLGRYVRGEAIEAKRESAWYVVTKLARRHRAATTLGGIALAAILAGGIASWVLYARAEDARRLADMRYEQARKNGEQAKRSLAFVRDVFRGVDPYVAAGADTRLLHRILEDAKRDAVSSLANDPQVLASIRDMLGVSFAVIQQHAASRVELTESLRLRREQFGNEHTSVVESLLHLATLAHDEGNYDESLDLCLEVEQLLSRLPSASAEYTAQRLHIETNVAMARSEYPRALSLSQQGLELRRRDPDPLENALLQSQYDVARALQSIGRYQEAQTILLEVLAAHTKLQDEKHPNLIRPLTELGEIALEMHELELSRGYLERAIGICRASFPNVHPLTAAVLGTMSSLATTAGRYNDGLAHAEEALAIRRDLGGIDAPQNAASVLNVGRALKNLGRLGEAEPYYHEALRLTKNAGSQRVRATALNNLAALYKSQKKYEDSARLDREALDLRRTLFTGDHPDIAQSLNNLAVSMVQLGKKAEAEELYRECMTMQTVLFGAEHRYVAMTGVNLSDLMIGRDAASTQGLEIISRSVQSLERSENDDPSWLLRARFILACALIAHKKYAEAEPVLLQCEAMVKPGQTGRVRREPVLSRLAEVCDKQGKTADAARWRAELRRAP